MYAIINEKVELNGVKKMKDMKVIITRAMLAFIAFIFIIVVYAFCTYNSAGKGQIRLEEDRMVEYVLENYELKNGDEIKKIKIVEFKKNRSSGAWFVEVEVNSNYKIILSEDRLGSEIRTSVSNPDEVKRVKDKVMKTDMSKIEIEYN